jgi:thymidylate kinase
VTTQPTRTRGHFIVFEGGEGVGKSTQIAKLATYISASYPDLKVVQSCDDEVELIPRERNNRLNLGKQL